MNYELINNYKYKDLERFTYEQLEDDGIPTKEQYLVLFDPGETNFDNLGVAVLNDCISTIPIIKRGINDDYFLSITIEKDKRGKYKRVKPLSVIKALGQLFRIPNMDFIKDEGLTINIVAKHIFYDLATCDIDDRRVNEQNCFETLSRLLEYDYTKRFRVGVCDITTVKNANFINETITKAIFDKVLPRWGGELLRDNFTIAMKKRLGNYKPDIYIRHSKNASSIRKKVDSTELCTKLIPSGNNGIDITNVNDGRRYLLSNKSNKFPLIFPKFVKFEVDTAIELKEVAESYLSEHDFIQQSIEIDLIDLSAKKDLDNLRNAIKIELGDTVTAYDIDLAINEELRCISEEVNAITGVKIKTVLGREAPTILDSMSDLESNSKQNTAAVEVLQKASIDNEEVLKNINAEISNLDKEDKKLANEKLDKVAWEESKVIVGYEDLILEEEITTVTVANDFKNTDFKMIGWSAMSLDDYQVELGLEILNTNYTIVDQNYNYDNGNFDIKTTAFPVRVRCLILSKKRLI